jgi:serine/threonine-protein phosphatase 2A regulatory subunit B'
MFLQELLEVLDVCDISKLEPFIEKLFKRLIKSIASPHLQVSDRAMCFFENDFFLSILKHYKSKTFPILVPVIVHLAENHWHDMLQDSLSALRNILRDIDPQAFEKVGINSKDNRYMYLVTEITQIKKDRATVESRWQKLIEEAKTIKPGFVEPVHPYQEGHIVGKFNGLDNGNVVLID